jgi:hypothetical protein
MKLRMPSANKPLIILTAVLLAGIATGLASHVIATRTAPPPAHAWSPEHAQKYHRAMQFVHTARQALITIANRLAA